MNFLNVPTGTYYLSVSNTFGCNKLANFTVGVKPFLSIALTNASEKPATCNLANGFYVPNQFSTLPNFYTFIWQNEAGTAINNQLALQNVNSGTYKLLAEDSNGCKKNIHTATIIQTGNPRIQRSLLNVLSDSCNLSKGSISNASASVGVPPYQFTWSASNPNFTSNQTSIFNLSAKTYRLIVKDAYSCGDTVNIDLNNYIENLPTPIYFTPIKLLKGEEARLLLQNPYTNNGLFTLTNDLNNSIFQQNSIGNFNLGIQRKSSTYKIELSKGTCKSFAGLVKIMAFDSAELKMPNAFSPNSDGVNEDFGLPFKSLQKLESFVVYNRAGQAIFSTNNEEVKFTGYYNGKSLPVGTYYWIIKGINIFGRAIVQSGSVTLLR